MKNLIISYKKTKKLHHAYAIEGDKKTVISKLYNFIENDLKIKTRANPDFYFNEFENFGIDIGKEIRNIASRKALSDGLRIFVIIISSITTEAQNSLLKFFEEPTEKTHFFLIVQSSEIFLPTLRSRLHILSQKQPLETVAESVLISKFLKASKSERIELLKKIIEEKNKEGSLDFLNNLESTLYKNKLKNDNWKKQDAIIFEIIQKSRIYLRGRAPSVKMILENIALSV